VKVPVRVLWRSVTESNRVAARRGGEQLEVNDQSVTSKGGDAMTKSTETQPEAVPARATRAGEILLRWIWVEPRIWTARMLTALEQGVKGGRWFSLIDKIHPIGTLRAVFRQVAANKGAAGVDHGTWSSRSSSKASWTACANGRPKRGCRKAVALAPCSVTSIWTRWTT
jgi:hypothetical protein